MWGERIENFKNFDTNKDWEVTIDDINNLSSALKDVDFNKKNEIIEWLFEEEIKPEDRKKIADLLKQKLNITKIWDRLNADETGVNSYLYKALVWIENDWLAENVLERKREEKFEKMSYWEKIKYLDQEFDKQNKFNETKLLALVSETNNLLNSKFDNKDVKWSLFKLKDSYNTIKENNFERIFSWDWTNDEKILELNEMYKEINDFKIKNEEKIIILRKEAEEGALDWILKKFSETWNPLEDIGYGLVTGSVLVFKASKLASYFKNHLTFPYMSTDLYDFLKSLPRDVKLKGDLNTCASGSGQSKYLHKNYLYSKLPKEITERKKQGGFAPLPIFFKDTKQFNKIAEIILESNLTKKHFNKEYLEKILNNYRNQKDNEGYWFWYKQVQAFQIFNLITLVVWWESIMEGRDIKSLSEM